MTESTWDQDTTAHDKDGADVAPDSFASTGGVQAGSDAKSPSST